MKTKFPIRELHQVSGRLPSCQEFDFNDFAAVTQLPKEQTLTPGARAYLKAYGSVMDAHMDLSKVPEVFRTTVRLATASAIHRTLRTTTQREATLAGTSLVTFTTQKLLMIMRAYPQLFALQLFGFLPMRGPTARMFFKVRQYADALAGSSPVIAAGDATDDLTKYNKDYASAPEGSMARKVTFALKYLDIRVQDKRVLGEWSEQVVDDYEADFGEDAVAEHMDEAQFLLSWLLDRTMVDAATAAVPTANKVTHDANPAAYASADWNNQLQYDQRIYTHGIVPVIEKIRAANNFGPDASPNWAIVGTDVARLLRRQKGFTAYSANQSEINLSSGPIRDFGMLTAENIRVVVDPQYTANKMLFGRRPVRKNDPALYLGMYIPLQMTKDLYDPNTGNTTQGVRTRFAVAQPDTNTEPESAQLARCYGELTVSNASAV